MLGRLGDDKILTRESGQAEENYEAAWRRELGPCCEAPRRSAALDSGSQAGSGRVQKEQEWCADIPVAAFVVSVRDAAAPAAEGLLRPLIRRWQAGGCTTATFQLPVVQAVVDWKVGAATVAVRGSVAGASFAGELQAPVQPTCVPASAAS